MLTASDGPPVWVEPAQASLPSYVDGELIGIGTGVIAATTCIAADGRMGAWDEGIPVEPFAQQR